MGPSDHDYIDVKVDIGVLKTQVSTLTTLCTKMDDVIEKIVEQQERYNSKIYQEMEIKRQEKNAEMKEVHNRIDAVMNKVELTERRIMDEIRELREQIAENTEKEQRSIDKINQWRWTTAGGIIVIAWLISHVNFDIISKLF